MNPAVDRSAFLPTASLANLQLRAELLTKLRAFFAARRFWEVETPILSADVVVDRHLDPIDAQLADDARRPGVGRQFWLQTSPEFGMKRLLVAGATAIFQVTRAFRNGEIGPLHNPEFTMVEWYRAGDDMAAGMSLLSELCETLLKLGPAERLSYTAAFKQYVGVNPHASTIDELANAARRLNVNVPETLDDDLDGWLNVLLAECVEPQLGRKSPTILYDYPASQAALAIVREVRSPLEATSKGAEAVCRQEPCDPSTHPLTNDTRRLPVAGPVRVAERFELYVRGVELANGYHELLDAAELRRRNAANNAARIADGKPPLPEDSRLLAAMEAGLPACCGVALGFDRLVMLAAGANSIADVMAFPIDRA